MIWLFVSAASAPSGTASPPPMRRAEGSRARAAAGPGRAAADLLVQRTSGSRLDRLGRSGGAARKEFEVALHAGSALASDQNAAKLSLGLLIAATAPPALAELGVRTGHRGATGDAEVDRGRPVLGGRSRWSPPIARRRVGAGIIELGRRRGSARAGDRSDPGRVAQRRHACRGARPRLRPRGAAELSREVALPVLAGAAALKGERLVRAGRRRHGGTLAPAPPPRRSRPAGTARRSGAGGRAP